MANCYVVQITPLSSSTHADRPPVRYLASIDDNEYAPFEIELLGPYDLTTRPPLEKLLWVALECPRLDEGWGAHPAVICGDVYDREFDDEDADRDRIGKEKILLLTQVKASALDCATAPAQSSSARAPRV